MKERKSLKHLQHSKARSCGLLLRALLMSHSALALASLMKPHKVLDRRQIIHTHTLWPRCARSWCSFASCLECTNGVDTGGGQPSVEQRQFLKIRRVKGVYAGQRWHHSCNYPPHSSHIFVDALTRFWEIEKQWNVGYPYHWDTSIHHSVEHGIPLAFFFFKLIFHCPHLCFWPHLFWCFLYFLILPLVLPTCFFWLCSIVMPYPILSCSWIAPALSSIFQLTSPSAGRMVTCFLFVFRYRCPQHTEHTTKNLWLNK